MEFHPIQKIRSLPKAVKWMIAVLAFLFILSNLYHWSKVIGLPLFYYIPEHSFTVVDADTGESIEGVAAVEIYEMSPIYDSSEAFKFILPFLDPWAGMVNPAKLGSQLRIGLREGVSDSEGNIKIPSFGPVRRRRNFSCTDLDIDLILVHKAYEIEFINNNAFPPFHEQNTKFLPNWNSKSLEVRKLPDLSEEEICKKLLPTIYKVIRIIIGSYSIHSDTIEYALSNAKTASKTLDSYRIEIEKRCSRYEN